MNSEFIGTLVVYKGDDEQISATSVLVEVTEVKGTQVEVAFNTPKDKLRVYLTLSLPELVARAMPEEK
jgi:hypothetical protein